MAGTRASHDVLESGESKPRSSRAAMEGFSSRLRIHPVTSPRVVGEACWHAGVSPNRFSGWQLCKFTLATWYGTFRVRFHAGTDEASQTICGRIRHYSGLRLTAHSLARVEEHPAWEQTRVRRWSRTSGIPFVWACGKATRVCPPSRWPRRRASPDDHAGAVPHRVGNPSGGIR